MRRKKARNSSRKRKREEPFFRIESAILYPCVREATPPPQGPPPQYKFFDYKEGDSPEDALEKNPLLRALLGYTPMADYKPTDPIPKLAQQFGSRLANHSDCLFTIQNKLEKVAKARGSDNFLSAKKVMAEEPELVPEQAVKKKGKGKTARK
uniref:Mediator of RNA polymerase II transcription subunit 19 n=1 Tax=Caenorhabditis tropicalis TaxID=1561998 RepID=A0A1I7ULK1_9PELO